MIAIEREAFTAKIFAEILPLGQHCWNDSTVSKEKRCAFYGERDFQIEPDFDQYQKVSPSMIIITLRDDGRLCGYLVGFAHRGLHHKKILCGFADSMYVEPDLRSYAPVMAERFEKEMRELGVEIIGWPTDPQGPLCQMLIARGYMADDIVMEKRLCA